MIKFPNANEEQNKILNKIAEQKLKEQKAKDAAFDEEKDREEFLYLWTHFERRLKDLLKDFKNDKSQTGIHGLEIVLTFTKDGSKDRVRERFVYSDKLKLIHIQEIE